MNICLFSVIHFINSIHHPLSRFSFSKMKNLYSTKLVSRSIKFLLPLGILLILFGITIIILSSIHLKYNQSVVPVPLTNTYAAVESTHTEQSIWPTLAKGIWCGLFFIAVGVFTIVVYKEKTLISIRMLAFISLISIVLSLFLLLSSIIVFQRYIAEGRTNSNQRTSHEQAEVILNGLIFVFAILSFLVSLFLAIGSLITADLCQSKLDDEQDNANFYPQAPPPSYPVPPQYH